MRLAVAKYSVYGSKQAPLIWCADTLRLFRAHPSHVDLLAELADRVFTEKDLKRFSRRTVGNNFDGDVHRDLIAWGLIMPAAPLELARDQSERAEIVGFRIVVTEQCNLSCPACFSTTALRLAKKPLRTMSLETVEKLAREIVQYGRHRTVAMQFFGGEPLLYLDRIDRAIAIWNEAAERQEMCPPSLSVTTNGYAINARIISFLKKYSIEVGVSIEVDENAHNFNRRSLTGLSTYSEVSAGYRALSAAGLQPHILLTPYPGQEEGFVRKFELFLDRFQPTSLTINTPFEMDTLAWLSGSGHLALLLKCHRLAQELQISVDSALTPCLAAIGHRRRRLSPHATLGGDIMVSVDPEGHFSFSTHKWDSMFRLSTPLTLETQWAAECLSCEARYLCGGPNKEFQALSGKTLDQAKCDFHQGFLPLLVENLGLFEELPSSSDDIEAY